VESRAALGGWQRRGDEQRPTVPVGDDRHLRADEIAHSLRERVVGHEAHRDPGDDLGGAHRREEELVRVLTQHPEQGSVALARNILEQTRERSGAAGGRGRRGGEHPAVRIEEQHHVRADALGIVSGGRENGGRIAARDRLAEAEVGRQHGDAAGQLAGPKAEQVLGERVARAACGPAATLGMTVQSPDGHALAGAVVTARPLDAPGKRPAPVHAVMDQLDRAFAPDLLVIPVGSTVAFPNSDSVSHQIYSFSQPKRFKLPLYRGKPYPPVQFDQAGVVTLGCNIHDDMLAYLLVTDAPWFGRTDQSGAW